MTKVFMLCPGLGNIKRGYESFLQECFEVMSQEPSFDITLFKGGGESSEKEIILWNLRQQDWLNIQISNLTGIVAKNFTSKSSYFIECLSFFFNFLPYLQVRKPDVIYSSDEVLIKLLWFWRRWTKQTYKILFSNGAPIFTPHPRWDLVQQLTITHFRGSLNVGHPAERQRLVPLGRHIPSELQILTLTEREALRNKLGLPEARPLVISVGAINKHHKRMDYVITEIASLPEPRPFLLLLGQQYPESSEILNLGNRLLGSESFQIRTVPYQEVINYYKAADAFVLASLYEGFGLVYVEAMSQGLSCLVHDYEVTRFILEKEAYFGNFEIPGGLASIIPQALAEADDASKRYLRHRTMYNRFSWEKLRPEYVKLIQQCLDSMPTLDRY